MKKYLKIVFAYVSEHYASIGTKILDWPFLRRRRGGGKRACHILGVTYKFIVVMAA